MSSVAESHVMTFIVSEAILVGIFGRFIKNKCKTSRMGSFDEVLHDVSSYSKQKQKTTINRWACAVRTGNQLKRTDAQLSRYGINRLRAKHLFCYLDFRSYLMPNEPNCFHLLLHSKVIAKSTYRLLKRPLKKQTKIDMTKARHWSVLLGNRNCSVTSHTREWIPSHIWIHKWKYGASEIAAG